MVGPRKRSGQASFLLPRQNEKAAMANAPAPAHAPAVEGSGMTDKLGRSPYQADALPGSGRSTSLSTVSVLAMTPPSMLFSSTTLAFGATT